MLQRFGGVHGHDINREMQIVRAPKPPEPKQLIPDVDGDGLSYEFLEISCDTPVCAHEEVNNLFDNGQYGDRGTKKWNARCNGNTTLEITVKGDPIQISHYALKSANDFSGRDPKTWKMIAVDDQGREHIIHNM